MAWADSVPLVNSHFDASLLGWHVYYGVWSGLVGHGSPGSVAADVSNFFDVKQGFFVGELGVYTVTAWASGGPCVGCVALAVGDEPYDVYWVGRPCDAVGVGVGIDGIRQILRRWLLRHWRYLLFLGARLRRSLTTTECSCSGRRSHG